MSTTRLLRGAQVVRALTISTALLLVQCGSEEAGTGPDDAFLAVHLTPAEGDLTWEYGPDVWPIRLEPPLSWKVEFVSPVSAWKLDVTVRLLDAAGSTACFESTASLTEAAQSLPYTVSHTAFRLPEEAWWWQNPCGNDFRIGVVEVILAYGETAGFSRGGERLKVIRVPCSFSVTRTGYPGGPPAAGALQPGR